MNATQFNTLLSSLKSINVKTFKNWESLNYSVIKKMKDAGLEEDDDSFELEWNSIQITNKLCLNNKAFLPTVKIVNNLQQILVNYSADGRLKMKGFKAPAEPSKQDLYNLLIDVFLENVKSDIDTYVSELPSGLISCDLEIPDFVDFRTFAAETFSAIKNKHVDANNISNVGFQYLDLASFVYEYTKSIPTLEECESFEQDVKETAETLNISDSDDLIDNVDNFLSVLSDSFSGFDSVRKIYQINKTEFLDILVDFIDF